MEIFGIGPSELIFILLIAIIILGPKDMQKAGRTIGRWLNQFVRSDGWKALQRASKEIRDLPTNLMREANMEQLQQLDRDIRNNIDPRPRPATPRQPAAPPSDAEGTPPQAPTDNTDSEAQS